MRPWLRILLFLLIGISSSGKIPANNWHSYLSYYQIIAVTQGDQKIFAANENGLFSYQLSDNSLETRSRVEGLSDSGISAISWTVSGAGVLIGYSNGNLDLLSGNTISNLPDIKLKTSVAKKSIDQGMKKVEVHIKGPGSGRETAIRAIQAAGLEITLIKDVTPIPHNGCRPPKKRRI